MKTIGGASNFSMEANARNDQRAFTAGEAPRAKGRKARIMLIEGTNKCQSKR
jgi:hypothetical protein